MPSQETPTTVDEALFLCLFTRGEPTEQDRIAARMLAAMRTSEREYRTQQIPLDTDSPDQVG